MKALSGFLIIQNRWPWNYMHVWKLYQPRTLVARFVSW